MLDLTVVILTRNESVHIRRAMESVRSIAARIVVVDSFSDDDTRDIAVAEGADVFTNEFVNQAQQFNWALANTRIVTGWVLRLDADETLSPELCREIEFKLPHLPDTVSAVSLFRGHAFLGRRLRFGGRAKLPMVRLWRTGRAYVEDRWMDEHTVVTSGKIVQFKHKFHDDNRNGLRFFIEKHAAYAVREAVQTILDEIRVKSTQGAPSEVTMLRAVRVKRSLRRLYDRLPYVIAAAAYLVYRLIFKLGILDGRVGIAYHFLQGFWYRYIVGLQIEIFRRELTGLSPDQAVDRLVTLSGYKVALTRDTR